MQGYIEVDIPDKCKDCRLMRVAYNGRNRCSVVDRQINAGIAKSTKPSWCPIIQKEIT